MNDELLTAKLHAHIYYEIAVCELGEDNVEAACKQIMEALTDEQKNNIATNNIPEITFNSEDRKQ